LFVRKNNLSRNRSEPNKRKTRGSEETTRSSEHNPAPPPQPSSPNVALTLKHFHCRNDRSATSEGKRLYLGVGDEVNHLRHEEWGIGVVMEVMTSSIPGGTCLARVRFQDGQLRCFNNDLDNEACCYYFGLRRYWNPTHGVDAIRSRFFMGG
jgi:hypothetical protein